MVNMKDINIIEFLKIYPIGFYLKIWHELVNYSMFSTEKYKYLNFSNICLTYKFPIPLSLRVNVYHVATFSIYLYFTTTACNTDAIGNVSTSFLNTKILALMWMSINYTKT